MLPSVIALVLLAAPPALLPGFHRSAWFDEQVREEWLADGVRVVVNAPVDYDPARPTRLIIYATPNGNTIEQTLGSTAPAGTDWRFDIQHVAAQVRRLREVSPDVNVVVACCEAEGLSWPAWRKRFADSGPASSSLAKEDNPPNPLLAREPPAGVGLRVRKLVDTVRGWAPGQDVRITLAAHSGGGSFLFGFLDSADDVPNEIERFVFLDANYSYSDDAKHGDKLLGWLRGSDSRRLFVIAYDDRRITLNGKLVVGPTGGTFRATQRILAWFGKDVPLAESRAGDIVTHRGLGDQVLFHVHANPENKILHTALVGEMNGLLEATADATTKWGSFGGPRAYKDWVQPAAGIPARPSDAPGGSAVFEKLASLSPADREEAIAREILSGNIPDFLRKFQSVTIRIEQNANSQPGQPDVPKGSARPDQAHTATIEVMADYLAIGSDDDFVRVPMTPMTAQRIADAFGCSLSTRKIADEIYQASPVKLAPMPLTEAREATTTFAQHNSIIEKQRAGHGLGELVAGIKKDVVVTNRLAERPNRVAIYGWHKLDGSPIQPLTIVHYNGYVDYSHGIRLVRRSVTVDGKPRDIRHVLHSAELCPLLSDEGPLLRPSY